LPSEANDVHEDRVKGYLTNFVRQGQSVGRAALRPSDSVMPFQPGIFYRRDGHWLEKITQLLLKEENIRKMVIPI
jgi:hypothetical protein